MRVNIYISQSLVSGDYTLTKLSSPRFFSFTLTRLAEVKTPTGSVSKNNIDGNLRDAISSIKGSNKNPTEKAYIRLDYRQAAPTNWTGDEIFRAVNGRMVRVDKTTGIKGTDVVEFVEFLYKDTAGQAQKLVLQVQNGKLVILP